MYKDGSLCDSDLPAGGMIAPVAEAVAAVGAPVFMHTVGDKSSPYATIARWQHSGGDFDIRPSDFVRIAMNLQDGVPVVERMGNRTPRARVAAIGCVTVTPTNERTQISVQ